MNILQVTLGFLPAVTWGGPVKIVHQNSKELVKRGHQVTIYCTNLLDKRKKIQPGTFEKQVDGIRVVYFDTWRLRNWPGTLGPIWLPELPIYLKREIGGFDIVHLNGYRSPLMAVTAQAARRAGRPIVTQPHGTLPVIVNSFRLKRIYDLFFGNIELKGIDVLVALQESECQQALNHGVLLERIEVIPNGIDQDELKNLPVKGSFRRRFGLDPMHPLILFLGRINKKKGTDMLIEAFARMKNLNAQLAIAGPDDGQLREVRSLVAKYQLDNRVVFPGLLSGSDVLGAFQDADLFVLPCRADTFPVTIMEACLVSTPMVVTDRCEIADLIKDRVAEIVPFDAKAFADAMRLLLTDRERYERYKANCPEIINDTFSIESVVDRLESLYQRVVTEKANR